MSQWINDDKSVYIREDLAYKTIHCINLDVIEEKILVLKMINQFE